MSETAVSIGAVTYLNSKPLVEGLAELLPDTRIHLDFPSRLADHLVSGRLDVALVPSIEYFRGEDYEVLSDACVAAHGPVLSVKLYTRVPWGEIKTLALDEGSRTSATLARILLAERHGVLPHLEPLPLNHQTEDTTADAMLLIGDRAILPPKEKFLATWDLGEEWFHWTGLPFVFAMWVSNRRQQLPRRGCGHNSTSTLPIPRLGGGAIEGDRRARSAAAGTDFSHDIQLSFPKPAFSTWEMAERCGLQTFYDLAAGLGLAPRGVKLKFRSTSQPE